MESTDRIKQKLSNGTICSILYNTVQQTTVYEPETRNTPEQIEACEYVLRASQFVEED
jgi:hypothetical protein